MRRYKNIVKPLLYQAIDLTSYPHRKVIRFSTINPKYIKEHELLPGRLAFSKKKVS